MPSLLEHVRLYWSRHYEERLKGEPFSPLPEFDPIFPQICAKVEQRDRELKKSSTARTAPKKSASPSSPKRNEKQMRDWGDKVDKSTIASLDLSASRSETSNTSSSTRTIPDDGKDYSALTELDWDLDEPDNVLENKPVTGLWKYFNNLTGQKPMSKADLEEALDKMKDHLIQKNVASEVAQVICDSVAENLVGKKTGTFGTISNMVREATEVAVSKILVPKAATDLLDEIHRTREKNKGHPFVMAFVGVNGVGKSTNLSKVCFWLLQNKFRILMVAGDTFRSGAVEQLRTHVRNLSVGRLETQLQLFERGYGKDAAAVAKDAIAQASRENFDIVMIDTAGRMQDNAPLMSALAKLVYVNRPDKLIFVGEALVGNEAVDQLKKFNGALKDYVPPSTAVARIEGILLTKFDTIDDKVGAALSMTFIANAPILFVGTGQNYTDLRKLNARSIVAALLA